MKIRTLEANVHFREMEDEECSCFICLHYKDGMFLLDEAEAGLIIKGRIFKYVEDHQGDNLELVQMACQSLYCNAHRFKVTLSKAGQEVKIRLVKK